LYDYPERALRLERLEELAKKKRVRAPSRTIKTLNKNNETKIEIAEYLKQFKIPKVEFSIYPRSLSSVVSCVESLKEKKNSYEGDKRNLWMIRKDLIIQFGLKAFKIFWVSKILFQV
jgi:hypothetical protein